MKNQTTKLWPTRSHGPNSMHIGKHVIKNS